MKVKVGDHLRIRIKSDSIFSDNGYTCHNVECIAYRGSKKYLYDHAGGRDILMSTAEIKAAIVDDDNNLIGEEMTNQ